MTSGFEVQSRRSWGVGLWVKGLGGFLSFVTLNPKP